MYTLKPKLPGFVNHKSHYDREAPPLENELVG
jgi:hypothetical protein